MHNKLPLFLGMIAAMAVSSFAQPSFQPVEETAVTNKTVANELGRPRIVANKAAKVEASLIINTE